jgi:hypothetical protein
MYATADGFENSGVTSTCFVWFAYQSYCDASMDVCFAGGLVSSCNPQLWCGTTKSMMYGPLCASVHFKHSVSTKNRTSTAACMSDYTSQQWAT